MHVLMQDWMEQWRWFLIRKTGIFSEEKMKALVKKYLENTVFSPTLGIKDPDTVRYVKSDGYLTYTFSMMTIGGDRLYAFRMQNPSFLRQKRPPFFLAPFDICTLLKKCEKSDLFPVCIHMDEENFILPVVVYEWGSSIDVETFGTLHLGGLEKTHIAKLGEGIAALHCYKIERSLFIRTKVETKSIRGEYEWIKMVCRRRLGIERAKHIGFEDFFPALNALFEYVDRTMNKVDALLAQQKDLNYPTLHLGELGRIGEMNLDNILWIRESQKIRFEPPGKVYFHEDPARMFGELLVQLYNEATFPMEWMIEWASEGYCSVRLFKGFDLLLYFRIFLCHIYYALEYGSWILAEGHCSKIQLEDAWKQYDTAQWILKNFLK